MNPLRIRLLPFANMTTKMKKIWFWGGLVLLFVSGCSFLWFSKLNEPLPEGIEGPKADSLAIRILEATGYSHWEQTGAVSWSFRGSRDYLWDVKRNFARITWKDHKVLMDLDTRQGLAFTSGEQVSDASDLLEKAWSMWCNDSFWFMAHHKLFDPGTIRKSVLMPDSSKALLVSYLEGGVTPGDSYLWLLDESYVPVGWKMWVKVIPVGGVYFSWESWTRLGTGIMVAQEHNSDVAGVPIVEPKAAASLGELTDGVDVFQVLTE